MRRGYRAGDGHGAAMRLMMRRPGLKINVKSLPAHTLSFIPACQNTENKVVLFLDAWIIKRKAGNIGRMNKIELNACSHAGTAL
jgi:hypothetical protein